MSDKLNSVVVVAPVAAPGRFGASPQRNPGNPEVQGATQSQGTDQTQVAKSSSLFDLSADDVVTLQSLQAQDTLQTGPGKPPAQSTSQAQAQAQATLYAAKAAAQSNVPGKGQSDSQTQSNSQVQQGSLEGAASTLSGYFSSLHPNVSFRVEQKSEGEVVVMVDSVSGKVLQTISGDEARQLASSLFGKTTSLPQTA